MTRVRLALALCLLGVGLPVSAQQASGALSESEILDRFQQQKTRGLSIAPVAKPTEEAAASADSGTAVTGIQVLPVEEQVNINIAFDFDSAALREDQKPKLVELCGAMKALEQETFRILGHTDASGPEDYNQRLSLLRAEEVKRYLVGDCGIPPDRLLATGVGERFLLDKDDPLADVNRRVEFQLIG